MRELKRVTVSGLKPDPDQPRKQFDESELLALGQSMKQHGQQVPIILCGSTIIDGERRWRAAQTAGISELDAVVLASRPTATELRLLQMSIDAHRVCLSSMERSEFLARIRQENNWSVSELADKLSMKQPLVTKLLKLQAGCEEVRTAVHAGLDVDKAYTICQETDHDKQRALLKDVSDLTREQLRQKAKSPGGPVDLKASIARFPLPKGFLVTVQGPRMSLSGAVQVLQDTVKELKKALAESLDISTASKVMRDRAQAVK